MIPISVLEVPIALAFFSNKVFLLIGKRAGWTLGLIASSVSVYYFFRIELYIFMVPEVGFAVLMWYALGKGKDVNPHVEFFLRVMLTAMMAFLAYFLFGGPMTVVECIAALLSMWAMYFLTHDHVRRGWTILAVGHCLAAFVFDAKGQVFFSHIQIASIFLAIGGAVKGGNSVIESSV